MLLNWLLFRQSVTGSCIWVLCIIWSMKRVQLSICTRLITKLENNVVNLGVQTIFVCWKVKLSIMPNAVLINYFTWSFSFETLAVVGEIRWQPCIVEICQVYGSCNYIHIFKVWKSTSNQKSNFLPYFPCPLVGSTMEAVECYCLNPLEWG